MDRTEAWLRQQFVVPAPPALAGRLRAALRQPVARLESLADRFHFEATEGGISRLLYGRGRDAAGAVTSSRRARS
jgi:hypothetical protein